MDQNASSPPDTPQDTSQTPTTTPIPTQPTAQESSDTVKESVSPVPSAEPTTAGIADPPMSPQTLETTPPPTASPPPSVGGMPKTNNKKTIAVAAAGISVILVILGVSAMTKDNFNTQTKQEAALKTTTTQNAVTALPTVTPTPSDVVEQNLGNVDATLKNVDKEASMADQGLSATPADLH